MIITSAAQALLVLDDVREAASVREEALRYLTQCPTRAVIARVVQALQDDDFGVRWEAAAVLGQQGEPALVEVLKALTDPKRVGDPRLREGAYHILHNHQAALPVPVADLLAGLRGPAADITSLVEANRVLRALEKYRAAQAAAKSGATDAARTSIRSLQYGRAHLTGRLSRLTGHRFN